MNFEYYLYQYLLKYNKAEVPDFGVFKLTKESAKIDAENSIITPPKELITFQYIPSIFDNHLARYISEETGYDLSVVQEDMKKGVLKWFQKLKTANNILYLENIGQFQLDGHNKVVKITDDNDDIFGLEAINLKTLKNKLSKKSLASENYSFNKNVIWTFFVIIILGSVSLFVFGDQELIFGKSSQIPTKKLVKKTIVRKVLTTPKIDSTKIDSIKPTTNAKIQKTNR